MNVYVKLQKVRVELQQMNIKKSGTNKFSGYNYYELSDFLPVINKLFMENGLFSQVTFNNELATLKVINAEKPEEVIEFTSPLAESNLKGAQPIQNLGSTQTYLRRYLYMSALEIVESDVVDSIQGKEKETTRPSEKQLNFLFKLMEQAKAKPFTQEQINSLTAEKCSDMIKALKTKLGINN